MCTWDSGVFGDTTGDGCDWYEGREEYCGTFDTDDFQATACCQCGGIAAVGDEYFVNLKADAELAH